jgi:hypothetical protein
MSSTLSVIGLVTKSKTSNQTMSGEAIYREKVSENNIIFAFKQFMNARNEYNETLTVGDLVSFAGKFTVDEQKLFVSIYCSMFRCYVNNGSVDYF